MIQTNRHLFTGDGELEYVFRQALKEKPVMESSSGPLSRLETVMDVALTTFHWGFIPLVIYLGFKKGPEPEMPPLSLLSLLWQ